MKIFPFLAIFCPAAFGFEISRDTLVSRWVGGDSVWLVNRSAQQVRISSIYVKRISGPKGDGIIFKVSNAQPGNAGFSHWYTLASIGDSLFVPPGWQNNNPDIVIPPRDSVHVKNIIYGSCIFCLSTAAPYDYSIELNFVETGRAPEKLVVVGNFVSGAARRAAAPPNPIRRADRPYRIDGRLWASPAGAPRPPDAGYGR